MKSITIDISDKAYKKFREFLELLPEGSFKIYDDDSDELTAKEEQAYYSVKKDIENGDFSDFEDWDDVKEDL
ncbi:hypothetical protein [Maribellus sediminis]|uniref:hypothetical protein n=1 Tax=Maribellus sediminis TaxID=2696285 RepID=UPI0014308F9D|nr:hypothetical protein [Maribellus sediminis]